MSPESSSSRLKKYFHRSIRKQTEAQNSGNAQGPVVALLPVNEDGSYNANSAAVATLPRSNVAVVAATTSPPLRRLTPTPHAGDVTAGKTLDSNLAPASLPERLWDTAYDDLKTAEPGLVQAYEKILSRRLLSPASESVIDDSQENVVVQNNVGQRRKQMRDIIDSGLEKTAREARIKDKVARATKLIDSTKDVISSAVQAAPQAALAWTGISLALDILANPLAETESNRSGIKYVIERMNWYLSLSRPLLEENLAGSSRLSNVRQELELHVVELYKELLSYQVKSVCSYYRNRSLALLRDLVKLDDWDGNIEAIYMAERRFNDDANSYRSQEMSGYLEQLVHHAIEREETQMTEKDKQCLKDLHITDPRDDKKRIEEAKGGLLPDLYRWVLHNRQFQQWRDDKHSRLLWIKGDPGKGKTMLLCGIIDELNSQASCLVSTSFFFCQATDPRINSATAVVRGLIFSLVKQQPQLISHVRAKYDDTGKQLFEGVNAWFALSSILADILQDQALATTCLIIDALDECVFDLIKLLKFVVEQVPNSSRVKWIVSSRNWHNIAQQLELANCAGGTKLSLEVNAEAVAQAVDLYITHKVSQLTSIADNESLQKQVRDLLCQKADSTFLWVALVFEELQKIDSTAYEHDSDLLEVIYDIPSGLTNLYDRMLQQIGQLTHKDPEYCRTILSVVSLAYRPLNLLEIPTVAGFSGRLMKLQIVKELVSKCGSFLTCRNNVIYFIHQSAQDYLVAIFKDGIPALHQAISCRSLQAISTSSILKRNIYGLPNPGVLIDEVEIPDPDPLGAFRYSCVYWARHLCNEAIDDDIFMQQAEMGEDGAVAILLNNYFIYWLEALSLLRSVSEGALAMERLKILLDQRSPASQLCDLVEDARRFVLHNRNGVEIAPLQVYFSALLFSPSQSLMCKIYKERKLTCVSIKPSVGADWSPCLQTLEGHGNWISAVAFSPDGKTVASGSGDWTVRLWDTASGAARQTLEGHGSWIRAVAFSPDGKTIASGSDDGTVRLWDTASGAARQILEGHGGSISAVAFSPDGKTVASGSRDRTVRLWDTASGAARQMLKGHGDWISAVAFSPDGKTVASGSYDETVRLWDAVNGHCLRIFTTTDTVMKLSFSANGGFLKTEHGSLRLNTMVANTCLDPQLESFSLFVKDDWIIRDSKRLLWIHPDERPRAIAHFGNSFAFGLSSGVVRILEVGAS